MARSGKNRFAGVIVGPIVVLLATCALWKNEGRFDYHRAAKGTDHIESTDAGQPGQLISYTNSMDTGLTLKGEYVQSMVGYLTVERAAEIHVWHEDKDDDSVTWRMRWMSRVERNSRNSAVKQQLTSTQLRPDEYQVGELAIGAQSIEFVDAYKQLPPAELTLNENALKKKLHLRGEYFYLSKGKSRELGDERISYSGVPVPETATYFGKFESGRGTAHQAVRKDSFIDAIIQDTGVLHHLVAGERALALQTMKAHLARLKWIVRGVGIACISFGFVFLFSAFVGFLFQIPVVGDLAEWGVMAVSILLGVTLGIATIVTSYLAHHPLALVALLAAFGLLLFLARKRAKTSQQALKRDLDRQYGHELKTSEIEELKFLELAQVALSDSKLDVSEKKYLKRWAVKHGWGDAKFDQMLARAKSSLDAPTETTSSEGHLKNLIRLSLADGQLKTYEVRSIQKAAKDVGYDRGKLQQLVREIRQSLSSKHPVGNLAD